MYQMCMKNIVLKALSRILSLGNFLIKKSFCEAAQSWAKQNARSKYFVPNLINFDQNWSKSGDQILLCHVMG